MHDYNLIVHRFKHPFTYLLYIKLETVYVMGLLVPKIILEKDVTDEWAYEPTNIDPNESYVIKSKTLDPIPTRNRQIVLLIV